MSRVSFASDAGGGQQGERSPLLTPDVRQASRLTPSRPNIPSILLNNNPLQSPKSVHGDAGSGSYTYLPLYKRTKPKHQRKRSPCWRAGTCAACIVLIINLVVLSTLLLDNSKAQHPTGPYPAPPSSGIGTGSQKGRNPAYLIEARNGAVASENGLCSEMGVEVLKDGGNAVDAAVATTFCVGVVNLFS